MTCIIYQKDYYRMKSEKKSFLDYKIKNVLKPSQVFN